MFENINEFFRISETKFEKNPAGFRISIAVKKCPHMSNQCRPTEEDWKHKIIKCCKLDRLV